MVNWLSIGSMLLPNVGGWAGAATMAGQVKRPDGKAWYQTLKKPSWNPPDWVFGPAWTALYTSMGYASYMVYQECGGITDDSVLPLALYGGQLVLNWTWSPVFFRFHKIGLAFIHIVALDVAAAACTASFFYVKKDTIFFMAPYLAWLSFASFLNYTIWKLNPEYDEKKDYSYVKDTIFLMASYLAWLSFASFLNYTIWKLNPEYDEKKDYSYVKDTIFLMASYLAWLSFASFLNYTIWKLNPEYDEKKE